jgi:integrase
MIRFALSTGCRAREITGLEWGRVTLERRTAWLDRTNGAPRGVPLNEDAVAVLETLRFPYVLTWRGTEQHAKSLS